MGDFVRVETEAGIATIWLERPPVNALNGQVQDRDRRRGRAGRRGPGGPCRHPLRRREDSSRPAPTSRRWPGPAMPGSWSYGAGIEERLQGRSPDPQAGDRGDHRVRAGRRPGAGAVRRLPRAGREGQGRPAGDPARHHPRRGRHPAAAPADRPVPGQGPRLQRAGRRRGRGAAHRPGRPGGARRRGLRGGPAARGDATPARRRWRCAPPSRPSTRAWNGTWTRAWRSSGCTSPGCSAPRTSRPGCAASWRTAPGRRPSVAGESCA